MSNKSSQEKVRNIMKKEGKISISDFITERSRDTLNNIKIKNDYRRLGDSIDFLVKYYLEEIECQDTIN